MKINIRRILSAFTVIAVASCRYLDVVPPEQPDLDDIDRYLSGELDTIGEIYAFPEDIKSYREE